MRRPLCLLFILTAPLAAQPSAYTIRQVNSMFGAPAEATIYRDGSKAAVEVKGVRTVYDLATRTSYAIGAASCKVSRFADDWGDPFVMSKEVTQNKVKDLGTDIVNGVHTEVFEVGIADGKAKAWVDPKSGLVMKAAMGRPILEIKQATFAPPDPSVFALPPSCAGSSRP
ncbi:MAG: hypothetical protein KGN84_21755 [Acidobacteriota bacterium]|nr:hypothetical protein [Acidobacteriota bacterium]